MNKETILRVDQMLEYYDVPQLFVARDSFDTLYLCLLYSDETECKYTAIRVSHERLARFMNGDEDLRSLYVSPENSGEYFDVTYVSNAYHAKPLGTQILQEERLPAEGYKVSSTNESLIVNLPYKDKPLFFELVKKFGWVCM